MSSKEIGFWEMGLETGRVLKLLQDGRVNMQVLIELGPPVWQDELFYPCTDYVLGEAGCCLFGFSEA